MLLLIGFLAVADCYGQARDSAGMAEYKKLIAKEYIDGFYIPRNVEDAIEQLKKLADEKGLEKFKKAPEEEIAQKLHFGLGQWIQKNWNLVDGSRYAHFLRGLGLTFPADMVDFTIVSLHRSLHNKPLDIEERVAEYVEIRKKEHRQRMKDAEVIYKDTLPASDSLNNPD